MRTILSRLLAMGAILLGASSSASAEITGTGTSDSLPIDRFLAIAARPDARLEDLSSWLDLDRKTRDESTSSPGATYWIPALDTGSGVARARVGLRPGSDTDLATVLIVIAHAEGGQCLEARAFALRYRLMPSPPPHPWDVPEAELRRVRYVGRQGTAQVTAAAPGMFDCVEEIHVWHRYRDRATRS